MNGMRGLDLRNAPRDTSGRLMREEQHITSQDQNSDVTSHSIPSFSVDVRRDIFIAVRDGARTRGEIAKAIGRKKTPWLNGLIEELVERGYLSRAHGVWKNGCQMYFYSINGQV